MIADAQRELAAAILVCWLCGVLILLLTLLLWPLLPGMRRRSRAKASWYGDGMSEHESMSLREWLLHPILARIEQIMATTLAQLNTAIAANTAETALAVAAITSNVAGDFTPQATQIQANTAALAAAIPNPTTIPPAGPITASPALVALSPSNPTQVVTLTDTITPNTFNAVSNNTAIVTVSPASGPGPFTITRVGAGIGASVVFTDAQNNVLNLAVSAS
jgi:hypothetical protein